MLRAGALLNHVDLVENKFAPLVNRRTDLGDVGAARGAVQEQRPENQSSSARTCLLITACDKRSSCAAPEKLCFSMTFAKTPMLSIRSTFASRDLSRVAINHMPNDGLIAAGSRQ